MDVTHLAGNLWIGSAPRSGKGYEQFDVVYFVAEEIPPVPGLRKVHFMGFDDGELDGPTLMTARIAADSVTRDLVHGRTTLVTCAMGRNRSALVCAIALHMMTGTPGREIAAFVSQKRHDRLGHPALSNDDFRAYVESLV
jgi:protein-tyrosine phosphatase